MLKLNLKRGWDINPEKEYFGHVEKVELDEHNNRLRIHVFVNDFPNRTFYQSLKIDLAPHSDFCNFCYRLDLVDGNGNVDETQLENMYVMVFLKEYNQNIYVRFIRYAEPFEVDQFQCEEDTKKESADVWNDCTGQEAVF